MRIRYTKKGVLTMERKITVLPGDGIGPEVVASAVRVLQVIGKRFNHTFHLGYATIGGARLTSTIIHYRMKQSRCVKIVMRFY